MARLPYLDLVAATPRVREILDSLPARLNVFRMMAHAERNFGPLVRLGGTILARQQLDAKLRELAILRVARLSTSEYEWVQHVAIARSEGTSEEQIQAIAEGRIDEPCLDETERLVLAFTDELVRDVRVSDASFERARARFSPREIVELIVAVGFYMMMARLMETTGVDVDEPLGGRLTAALG